MDEPAKNFSEKCNGVIRKAVREWLDKKGKGSPAWPPEIVNWQGIPDFPPFESYRDEMLPPRE